MIYLVAGVVVNEGIDTDARENGTLIGERLFTDEDKALECANNIVQDLITDGGKIDSYANSLKKLYPEEAPGQYEDVWVVYSDYETVKVTIWQFNEIS